MNCNRSNLTMGTMLVLTLLLSLPAWAADINVTAGANKIQDAITAANDGDIIHLANGTYIESGQIVINKNISIIGAVRPVIKPGTDTGSAGDARGWWLVTTGGNLNLQNVVIDGDSANGKKVNIAVMGANGGTATINDCEFRNIKYSTYTGRAIAIYNAPSTISNNIFKNIERIGMYVFGPTALSTISGNTYYGKGVVDALDYGIEVEGGAVATIQGNKISNCLGTAYSDGSTSAGILITTYFAPGATATITNNVFTDNTSAIAVGYDGTDTSTVVANYNLLAGNSDTAINNTSSTNSVNAQFNSWGTSNSTAIALMVYGLVDTSNPLDVGVAGSPGVTAVSAATLAPGATATATLTGTTLELGLPQGLQGPAGTDGAPGPQGSTGLTGSTGSQGPIGLTGATGSAGSPDSPTDIITKIATQSALSVNSDTVSPSLLLTSATETAGQAPSFSGRKAHGTTSVPTATRAGDNLFTLSGIGFNGTAWNTASAVIYMPVRETFTPTAKGADIGFLTTAPGTTSRTEKLRITGEGNIGVGTSTPTQKLEVSGNIKAAAFIGDGTQLTGIIGLPGPTGPQGPQGLIGLTGATGPQGPAGANGANGANGATGPLGPAGSPDTGADIVTKIATQSALSVNSDAVSPSLFLTSATETVGQAPTFSGRKAHGTTAAPTATQAGDNLFTLSGIGYNGTAWNSASAVIYMPVRETFTPTAKGADIGFLTTAPGTTSRTEKLRITGEGNIGIGTSTPGQKLEVNGGVRMNTISARPACDAATRGTFWVTQGAGAANDSTAVCVQFGGLNTFVWKVLF